MLDSRPRTSVSCTIARDDVLRMLGHAGQPLEQGLVQRIDELSAACAQGFPALYEWKRLPIACVREKAVVLGDSGGLVLSGSSIVSCLDGARSAVLMACTLGAAADREIQRLGAVSALDGAIFSACANVAIESAAEAVQADVAAAAAAEGFVARMRFSPGYGDLPLDVQPRLLDVLDARRGIGLTVNESLLMVPTKSITAVIGLFDEGALLGDVSPCASCASRDYCSYLSRGVTCHGR